MKIDFPRVPLPHDAASFQAAAAVGARLVALHLLEDPALSRHGIRFPVAGDHRVKQMKPAQRYQPPTPADAPGRVWLNEREYFDNVSPDAWAFRVGGYQPAAKWLEDRVDSCLTEDDITYYRKMLAALRETVALFPAADAAFARIIGDLE